MLLLLLLSCVGDDSVMDVRIKKLNVNVNPYSYSYFVVLGLQFVFDVHKI